LNLLFLQNAFVIQRHGMHEEGKEVVEVIEDAICDFRPSITTMVLNEATQRRDFTRISDFAKLDISMLTLEVKLCAISRTYTIPPLMLTTKLHPVVSRTTTRPPVMYSHPWSPVPSRVLTTLTWLSVAAK